MKFTITVEMKDRWIPHFLGTLDYQQYLGNIGSSRMVSIYADGDGDYQPKFEWDKSLPEPAEPIKKDDGDVTYDAG